MSIACVITYICTGSVFGFSSMSNLSFIYMCKSNVFEFQFGDVFFESGNQSTNGNIHFRRRAGILRGEWVS